MTDSFQEAFRLLMSRVGCRVDEDDEHARLDFYRSLISDPQCLVGLLECLRLEPDLTLSTGVLVELLEHVAPDDRTAIVEAAPDSGERFITNRKRDLSVLERAIGPAGKDATMEL